MLCIQTEFQKDMLNAFGHLETLVIIDEYGEGVPIAWMLCNRQDAMAVAIGGSEGGGAKLLQRLLLPLQSYSLTPRVS